MDRYTQNDFNNNLEGFARIAQSVCNAFSAFIFLPKKKKSLKKEEETYLELCAFSSSQENFNTKISININSTIIGYVARHKNPIHISPFDKESKHIGISYTEEILKSIIALPIVLDNLNDEVGVLLCDSKENYAFSKKQCLILNEITNQIANSYKLYQSIKPIIKKIDWNVFIEKSKQLINTLTPSSVDILRIKFANLNEIEANMGTGKSIAIVDLLERLISQCIPYEATTFRLPSEDIVIILDNMMTSHIENKILSITKRISSSQKFNIKLDFSKRSCKALRHQGFKLEDLISSCRKDDKMKNNKNEIILKNVI